MTVPAGTNQITLTGSLINGTATARGLSTYTLDEDETTIQVVVTEEDETVTVYTIIVVREKEEVSEEKVKEEVVTIDAPTVTPVVYVYSSNTYLKNLSIKDYDINFEKGILEYRLKVAANVKFLDITATAEDYRSRVEINGNEEFKEGMNTVTIKVTAEDGSTREYKLLVEKAKEKTAGIEEKEENTGKTEKIVIITLIILVVGGILYLIFMKDDGNGPKIAPDTMKKSKKN